MSWLKPLLLHVYYGLQLPRRRRAAAARAAAGRAPVLVLCYHRVADDRATPWTQSNHSFARQIAWLREHFDLISLSEAQRRLRCGWNDRAAVSITFDDGYAANCDTALPLLIREGIPCTYFVSTNHVLREQPFLHDLDHGCRLAPNSLADLETLLHEGIDIGVHTRSHANLGEISDPRQLYEEVVVARDDLQQALGCGLRYFAFPFGRYQDLNAAAFALARQHGYEALCSAYGGYNFPGDDAFHLQRITADESTIRLKNWATLDSRKLHSVPRFDYEAALDNCLALAGAQCA